MMFSANPLSSCDSFLREYLNEFDANQKLPWSERMRADNATWRKFNNVVAHIFGIDSGLVPKIYRQYIRHQHGDSAWKRFEHCCEPRARAELREIASASKPISSHWNLFKQRYDKGAKSGLELNGPLSTEN